jgi:hypothetical protein
MRALLELNPAHSDDPLIKIEWQPNCSIELFRDLYREVGRNYLDRSSAMDRRTNRNLPATA